jgi:succinate dehydrogenase / fumarate reductase membrane anchor subunit
MTALNEKSIRTPLGRARGLGSAKDGTAHWWMQRVTSVMLIPLCLYILFHLHYFLPDPYSLPLLIAVLGDPVMSIALSLSILIGFYHAYLGVQVIIEDYVHQPAAKLACILFNAVFFFFAGFACLYSLFYIAFALGR